MRATSSRRSDIAMSTYSLREQLGTIDIAFNDDSGQERRFRQENPQELAITEFPAKARAEFGVDTIETVAFQFSGVDDPRLDQFAATLRVEGMTLLNVAVDTGDLLRHNPDRLAADVAELTAWVDRCAALGSRFVRVNPGSPFNPDHGEKPPARLVEALVELGRHANSRGVRLLVENHGGPSSDPAWMNALLDACGAESLGLLLDLGNFDALLGPIMARMKDPEGDHPDLSTIDLTALYAQIEELAPRAELVHVKAHLVGEDGAVGPVDLAKALEILERHGYDGPLTVEYEGTGGDPWAKSRRVLDLTTELVGGHR